MPKDIGNSILCPICSAANLRKGRGKIHQVGRGLAAHFSQKHTLKQVNGNYRTDRPSSLSSLTKNIRIWYEGVVQPVLTSEKNNTKHLNECILSTTNSNKGWRAGYFEEYLDDFGEVGGGDILRLCESLVAEVTGGQGKVRRAPLDVLKDPEAE
ncbi:hypothetical protein TrRE_jg9538, partial [Triparma retinervis]